MRFLFIILFISLGVCVTVVADVLLKKSGLTDYKYLYAGIALYGLAGLPVALAFKYTDFGKVFLIWEILAVLTGIAVASWFYKEDFTVNRFIALALGFAALYFSSK
jgi:multidrug transporter EmrE-like cation transporter